MDKRDQYWFATFIIMAITCLCICAGLSVAYLGNIDRSLAKIATSLEVKNATNS